MRNLYFCWNNIWPVVSVILLCNEIKCFDHHCLLQRTMDKKCIIEPNSIIATKAIVNILNRVFLLNFAALGPLKTIIGTVFRLFINLCLSSYWVTNYQKSTQVTLFWLFWLIKSGRKFKINATRALITIKAVSWLGYTIIKLFSFF